MTYAINLLSSFVNIFAAPSHAFRNLNQQRLSAWLPLVTLVAAWVLVWSWYYRSVDFTWLVNHIIQLEGYTDEAQIKAVSAVKPGALIVIAVMSVVLVLMAVTSIMSLYLVVVSAIVDDPYRLRHWFSFAVWGSLPSLASIIAMVSNFVLAADQRIGPEQLNPLTFNNLFFHLAAASPFKRLLDSVDIPMLWSWAVMVIGYREWTRRSWLSSAVTILAPPALVYGIWIVLIVI